MVLLERISFIFSAIVVWCCMAVGEPKTGDPLPFLAPKSFGDGDFERLFW
jgi:hypothetical protein